MVPQCTWCTWAWAPWWFLSPLFETSQVLERTPWMMSVLCAVASKLQLWCDHKWGLCFQAWIWALPLWHAHAMFKKRQTWDINQKLLWENTNLVMHTRCFLEFFIIARERSSIWNFYIPMKPYILISGCCCRSKFCEQHNHFGTTNYVNDKNRNYTLS